MYSNFSTFNYSFFAESKGFGNRILFVLKTLKSFQMIIAQDTLLGFPAHTFPFRYRSKPTLSTVRYATSLYNLSKCCSLMYP